jgi:hypothetical protein
MDLTLSIVGGLVAAAVTGFAGYRAGVALRARRAWVYWAANGACVLAGTALIALGYLLSVEPFTSAGLAAIAGGLTGMKYGLGQVTGIRVPQGDR